MKPTLLLVALGSLLPAASPFAFEDRGDGRLALTENGKLVFIYNYGRQLKPGVPQDRARSGYLHPVSTPSGVVVTDDFPRDHYHHRGLFWAWPVVRVEGATYDLWALKGGEQRFVRWREKATEAKSARLAVENAWYATGREIASEIVEIIVERAIGPAREFAVALTLEAHEHGIDIAGAPENGKGYGGFSCRFAPREGTLLRADAGDLRGDEDHGAHAWAELEGKFGGSRAGLRITADPVNPGFPHEWCLRQYGFVGANFPGAKTRRLEPGKPLTLHYRVKVFDVRLTPGA